MTAKYLWELNKEKEDDIDAYDQTKEVSECTNRNMSRPPSETNTRWNDRSSDDSRRNVSSEEEVANYQYQEENSTRRTRSQSRSHNAETQRE